MNDAQAIRDYYKVPAKRGMRITVDGREAYITGFRGAYLLVRFTEGPLKWASHPSPCHPTWRVVYPDVAMRQP
jgi:hypothetical protein